MVQKNGKVEKLEARITAIEQDMATLKVVLENIDKNVSKIATQMEVVLKDLEPWKLTVHDNQKSVDGLRSTVGSNKECIKRLEKQVDKLDDSVKSTKAWIAGAVFVISAVIFLVQFYLDNFI